MKIESKDDLDSLVSSLINKKSFENKRDIFLTIREKTLEVYISQGSLLPSFYSLLYFIFKDLDVESDLKYVKHIDFFKNYYNQATLEEKYVISNFIFRLEVLNGNFENGIKEYIKRWLIIKLHKDFSNEEVKEFVNFIIKNKIDVKILVESFKELIDKNIYLSLNLDERRAIFVNALSVLWNSPSSFNSNSWLEVFDDLVELLNELIKQNRIEEHMYIHFFTYHIFGNNIQTIDDWRVFNEKVEKPASRFYKEWSRKRNLTKSKTTISSGKKRVAFLVGRMVWNSPMMVLYSLIKALKSSEEFNENYDVYIYSLNYIDKQEDRKRVIDEFLELGVKFFTPQNYFINQGLYYSHLQKTMMLREKIIDDKIDFLIGAGGYDISIFLFASRSAPKQLFWSHGNCVSDLEGIDDRISHFEQECKEWEWKIFKLPLDMKFLVGTEYEKKEGFSIKNKYIKELGEDTIILGTIGRLVKIDSEEYLNVIARILNQNQNVIYLACGAGDKESIKYKIKKLGIDSKRFIFTGHVNPHIYGWVIDIWPDTFPLGQGLSKEEFLAKGKPIVFHRKREDVNGAAFKEEFFVAKSDEEYIKLVCDLFENRDLVKKIVDIEQKYQFSFNGKNLIEILNL